MMYFMTKKMMRTMMTKMITIMCRALGRKGAHLPFRASKLTQVLRDSFIGDKVNIILFMWILVSSSLSPITITVHNCVKKSHNHQHNASTKTLRQEPA